MADDVAPKTRSNRWWFVHESEYPEEGSQLVAADTAEEAERTVREGWGPLDDELLSKCRVTVDPVDDIAVLEKYLRSEDPKDLSEAIDRLKGAEFSLAERGKAMNKLATDAKAKLEAEKADHLATAQRFLARLRSAERRIAKARKELRRMHLPADGIPAAAYRALNTPRGGRRG